MIAISLYQNTISSGCVICFFVVAGSLAAPVPVCGAPCAASIMFAYVSTYTLQEYCSKYSIQITTV